MSRSKHTAPPALRAARRVLAPYGPRGQGERRREQILARLLKEGGIVAESVETLSLDERPMRWPRLYAQRTRTGHLFGIVKK
jgi:hypothetical protein